MTKDEKTQADALSVVLSLQYFSAFHARAMAEESGFALLKRILLSPECKIGYHTLKVFSWSIHNQLSYFSLKGDKHPITFPLSICPGGAWTPCKPQASSSGSLVTIFFSILSPNFTTCKVTKEKTKSNTCIFLSNQVLMEAACSGDVFKPTNLADDPIMLNIDSTAVVRNVAIFQHFLLNWKIWEKAKQGVLEMLLATIDILVHGSHCYYEFNIIQFQKAQLVQQILIGCQVRINIK